MHYRKQNYVCIAMVLCSCLLIVAAVSQRCGAAAPLFEMLASARAAGLGGALLAMADDESAVFYNPAGLASIKETTFAAFYHRAFETINHLGISGATRGWGAQIIQIDSGSFARANEFGNPASSEDESARYESRAGLLGFALGTEVLSVGGRAKFQQDASGFGWGLDLAGLVHIGSLRVGVVGENLLGDFAINLRAGAAFSFRFSARLGVTVAFDLWNLFSQMEPHLGIEGEMNGLRVRLGHDGVAFTSGAGVRWGSVRIDWAYRMHPQLPASTIVTVAYLF